MITVGKGVYNKLLKLGYVLHMGEMVLKDTISPKPKKVKILSEPKERRFKEDPEVIRVVRKTPSKKIEVVNMGNPIEEPFDEPIEEDVEKIEDPFEESIEEIDDELVEEIEDYYLDSESEDENPNDGPSEEIHIYESDEELSVLYGWK